MSDLAKSLAIMGLAWASSCEAKYEPPYTVVKDAIAIHVNADGSSTEDNEYCIRIETQAGVNIMGEQRISYVSKLEDVEVLEAYTGNTGQSVHPQSGDCLLAGVTELLCDHSV